jgi:hypothetical protein
MNNTTLLAVVAAISLTAGTLIGHFVTDRYEVQTESTGIAIRFNKFSGRSWLLAPGPEWREIKMGPSLSQ